MKKNQGKKYGSMLSLSIVLSFASTMTFASVPKCNQDFCDKICSGTSSEDSSEQTCCLRATSSDDSAKTVSGVNATCGIYNHRETKKSTRETRRKDIKANH